MDCRRVFGLIATVLGTATVLGCGSADNNPPAPPLVSAKGKVVAKNGKDYAGGGEIQFRNIARPEFHSSGVLDAEGNFALSTIVGNKKFAGAQEDDVIINPLGQDQSVKAIKLRKKYILKAGQDEVIVKLE